MAGCPIEPRKCLSPQSGRAIVRANQSDRSHRHAARSPLARHGRRIAAVIDADDLDELLDLAEDMADIRAAAAVRAEMQATGETPIPWEQVKADLGLT